jgi:hypothetical protein
VYVHRVDGGSFRFRVPEPQSHDVLSEETVYGNQFPNRLFDG